MGSRPTPQLKTEQLDMDSFFDFNQGNTQPSPVTASSSRTDAMSPFVKEEQQQHFNGPSHDYGQFKQQVGLPVGSLANMPQNGMFDGFNSGIGDMEFNSGFAWNSGIDVDADMGVDFNNSQPMPAMFFPSNEASSDNFVNPNSVGGQEEPPSHVGRLWPGMHSQQAQQAAMQKAAQAQAVQQRQMKLQAQQAQYRQAANSAQSQSSQGSSQASHGNGKRASHTAEPHVEESISRLLNQMRQNNALPSEDDAESPSGNPPHIARMKKDEEEMDEDERLLASEEGKKLSSKERRQLRNKVSARAFRSRRKEYIGQLEGEVAIKTQESNSLRQENQALLAENERYRGLIETLLRHPAFTPFINDISKDPSVLMPPQHQPHRQQQPSMHPTPNPQPAQPHQQQAQQDMKPEFLNFDASQLQLPQSQPEQQQQQQVNLAMIPEENFSKLNLSGYQRPVNFNNYGVNAYVVTSLPSGPDPVDLLIESPARLPLSASANISNVSSIACSTSADSGLSVLLAKLDNAARNTIADHLV
ncbi:uncharacterized protein MYCFIDRAFT_150893 [Pseudocercospora fijiensis CIRAD86]|uniref:BZIP domain-containing protein n=1 Tax=Pseudocercospora fijiensis (strain CIRAD86) TaxID=383855 RepID=M3B9A0_PSEFD|nr:uncharacterized protein MYCFIDRAFT_150893 [Pseudocercospora fijiensis CIRAD86]EME85838.1 hypothetical protein MYCFIDRAFT_150893 [Pseudocercospora fijiensis CIRAD86]